MTLVTPKERPVVEGLLLDLGLPLDLLAKMRTGSTERAKVVALEARYVDEHAREELRRGAGRSGQRSSAVPQAPAFEQDGNGRGKRLTRTAPPRGAAATGSGRGTITGYDPRKGFGFIKQEAGGKDVFFHRKAVSGVDDRTLRPGMAISFALDVNDGKKLRAKRVTVDDRAGGPIGPASAHSRASSSTAHKNRGTRGRMAR
jgi:CspA family cold shock protein